MKTVVFAQQTVYENYNGIFYESRPDTANVFRYTEDNEIYQAGNLYYFDYQYITKEGMELKYQHIYFQDTAAKEGRQFASSDWEFVPSENLSGDAVVAFQIKVLPDICNEAQSCMEFHYITNNGEFVSMWETTGLIENEKNIWLHPPRQCFFRILEVNPFPFIQKPYEKGNTWRWSLKIGNYWSDKRWKEWNGTIESQYVYKIVDDNSVVRTPLGELNCYKIDSYAESELGKTYLTAYFHELYGFVRLEYINIDGSTLNIELSKVEIK